MRIGFVMGLGAAALAAAMVLAAAEAPPPAPPAPAEPAGTWGAAVGPSLRSDEFFPQRLGLSSDFKPFPGRRLLSGGPEDEGDWMYLDVWYIIGPFPNPDGTSPPNDRKYPPESVVDLDATYPGGQGAKLAWRWRMSNVLCVVPHVPTDRAVWYAWTEVYSDADREVWFAFGWDDFGKAWVNGELVADGGKTPHPWTPDRDFRKVRLKKGFSPVLVRLENARGITGFSVMVHPGPVK